MCLGAVSRRVHPSSRHATHPWTQSYLEDRGGGEPFISTLHEGNIPD